VVVVLRTVEIHFPPLAAGKLGRGGLQLQPKKIHDAIDLFHVFDCTDDFARR
jgi:hypothetical protein